MGYKSIYMRDGALLIEKYIGKTSFADIAENGKNIYALNKPIVDKFYTLSDLSEATFPTITTEQIQNLFKVVDENASFSNGMKTALYTGNIDLNDFNKAYEFSQEASSRPMAIITFSFLDLALDWLGIFENERTDVVKFLESDKL